MFDEIFLVSGISPRNFFNFLDTQLGDGNGFVNKKEFRVGARKKLGIPSDIIKDEELDSLYLEMHSKEKIDVRRKGVSEATLTSFLETTQYAKYCTGTFDYNEKDKEDENGNLIKGTTKENQNIWSRDVAKEWESKGHMKANKRHQDILAANNLASILSIALLLDPDIADKGSRCTDALKRESSKRLDMFSRALLYAMCLCREFYQYVHLNTTHNVSPFLYFHDT